MNYKIYSENPNLLSIINKNPSFNFGMFLKNFENGVILGHCLSENDYMVSFHKGVKNSFQQDGQSDIDFMQFCSPKFLLATINTLFSELIGKDVVKNELDSDEFLTTITIPSLYIDNCLIENGEFLLAKYFPQIKNFKNKIGKIYSFEVQCNSIIEAINILSSISLKSY